MFAKTIVGAAGLLVLATGGYLYWQGSSDFGTGNTQSVPIRSGATHGCCMLQQAASQAQAGDAEALEVMPREILDEGDE